MYGLFLRSNLARFPWKNAFSFKKVLLQFKHSALYITCIQKVRLKVPGQGEDGKDFCKIKALTAYSLLAAQSQSGSLRVPATLQPSEQLH